MGAPRQQPLKLIAMTEGDIALLSPLLKGAAIVGMAYVPEERRFAAVLDRSVGNKFRKTGFRVLHVKAAEMENVGPDMRARILSLHFEPAGRLITLTLSGDALIRLKIDGISVELRDFGSKGHLKRIGRPTKPPKPRERVPLGLRITPEMKRQLEMAAVIKGRSLSQEVELRLERSLDIGRHLTIARGDTWAPVLIHGDELLISLSSHPVPPGEPPTHLDAVVAFNGVDENDLQRLVNYFGGALYPYDHSNEEIDAAGEQWLEMQDEIRRGK
jgi:hypothetical protein